MTIAWMLEEGLKMTDARYYVSHCYSAIPAMSCPDLRPNLLNAGYTSSKGQLHILFFIIKSASFPQQGDDSDAEPEHSILQIFAE